MLNFQSSQSSNYLVKPSLLQAKCRLTAMYFKRNLKELDTRRLDTKLIYRRFFCISWKFLNWLTDGKSSGLRAASSYPGADQRNEEIARREKQQKRQEEVPSENFTKRSEGKPSGDKCGFLNYRDPSICSPLNQLKRKPNWIRVDIQPSIEALSESFYDIKKWNTAFHELTTHRIKRTRTSRITYGQIYKTIVKFEGFRYWILKKL